MKRPDGLVWRDTRSCSLLGMGQALPGDPLSTTGLLSQLRRQFDVDVERSGGVIAHRLGIRSRHVCRALVQRHEQPQPGCSNAELAARAVQAALIEAGLQPADLSYLIGHTASPGHSLPPNIARVAELLGYDGPHMELRQACTGFANALIAARGLLDSPECGPIAIVGSETGSIYFDPARAPEDHSQLVNLVQMGDGAAACIVARCGEGSGGELSNFYYGQIGRNRKPGFSLTAGGSDSGSAGGAIAEFAHDFAAVRAAGPELFARAAAAARSMGIEPSEVDFLIPHQANGRMAEMLAPQLEADPAKIFVNADRLGNTGSAAIWLALAELRQKLRPGERVLVLGAEATRHMFGGMLYVHA